MELALFFASNGIEAARVALNRAYGDINERGLVVVVPSPNTGLLGCLDVTKRSGKFG